MKAIEKLEEIFKDHEFAPNEESVRYKVYEYAFAFADEFNKQKHTAVLWSDSSVARMVMKKDFYDEDFYVKMISGEMWYFLRDIVHYILEENK